LTDRSWWFLGRAHITFLLKYGTPGWFGWVFSIFLGLLSSVIN